MLSRTKNKKLSWLFICYKTKKKGFFFLFFNIFEIFCAQCLTTLLTDTQILLILKIRVWGDQAEKSFGGQGSGQRKWKM